MKTLKPFFTYYGGKYRAAPKYPAPEHASIVEPFAGSAGYALRYADRAVSLCDVDPVIAGLWKYLVRVSPEEIRSIPLLANDQTIDDLGSVCQEARHLVGFWLNKGSAGPRNMPSAWMRSGTRPNSYWGEVIRERVASQVESIRHWRVTDGSYHVIPNKYATWFIDPPYQSAGRLYRCSSVDFEGLADWARSRLGLVLVCENDGATWMPFKPFMTSKTSAAYDKGDSKESLCMMRNTLPETHEHFAHYEGHRQREEAWYAARVSA